MRNKIKIALAAVFMLGAVSGASAQGVDFWIGSSDQLFADQVNGAGSAFASARVTQTVPAYAMTETDLRFTADGDISSW